MFHWKGVGEAGEGEAEMEMEGEVEEVVKEVEVVKDGRGRE